MVYLVRRDLNPLVHHDLEVLRVEVRQADMPDLPPPLHLLQVAEGVQVVRRVVVPPVKLRDTYQTGFSQRLGDGEISRMMGSGKRNASRDTVGAQKLLRAKVFSRGGSIPQ